ncbi:hypothetical protein CRG98_029219 [Punica granatum]|uniref:Uncharacterized protein n=1 Tax=Punica granatum TaxID=22663 RepID=A0A2I0J2D7_PUNGR|nr:hypothetical protein CRG98_029219 [Punica granatum]
MVGGRSEFLKEHLRPAVIPQIGGWGAHHSPPNRGLKPPRHITAAALLPDPSRAGPAFSSPKLLSARTQATPRTDHSSVLTFPSLCSVATQSLSSSSRRRAVAVRSPSRALIRARAAAAASSSSS